jgi:catechol 2,3-dioxygenase-like lactoylglutathione lyase family enzyme
MSCRLSELVIDCVDPEALSQFWCDVLGYVELCRETPDDGIEIGPASGFGGAAPTLVFSRTTTPRPAKLRLHIDVNPVDRDQAEELERLLSIGARPADVGQTGEEEWHVLQDPEGNEFCLLRRRLPEL